jgi:hypothetical protein
VSGRHAHVAHGAVLAFHAVCCGLPALAMILAAFAGTASGALLLPEFFTEIHHFLHGHEVWILALSALLVVSGGWLEVHERSHGHNQGFPWLFAFSALCFVANFSIIAIHRAALV